MSRPDSTAEIRPKPHGVQPRIVLGKDERLLRESASRFQEGLNSGTGRLYLTNHRLVWSATAHGRLDVEVHIPIETVAAVSLGWSHFMEVIPILPDALVITDVDANLFHFTVSARRPWARAIRAAVNARR